MTSSATGRQQSRVVVLDDHVLFAESLDLALTVEGYDVHRIGVPTTDRSAQPLLGQVSKLNPRVVLLDLDLGAFGDGIDLVRPIAQAGANVVVVTASSDRGRWGEAVHLGARAVLSKSRPLREILATVRRITQGLPVMSHHEREELLRAWQDLRREMDHLRARVSLLSAREREVLAHLMKGKTVREIAAAGVVSEATVRTQVKSILSKLEVSSQLAAVGLAYQIHWRPPPV